MNNVSIMRAIALGIAGLFSAACRPSSDEPHDVDTIQTLAREFSAELQTAKINPVCSEAGLQEVEKYLESKPEAAQQQYVPKVGAYLGECIIRSYGGQWVEQQPDVWAVKLSDNNLVFPFGKVQKFVTDPSGDSFSSLYGIIPIVFKLK